MGWTDYEFNVVRPEGAPTIPFQGGVLMIQDKDLLPNDVPYPVTLIRGKWDKGTTAVPVSQGIAFGGPRVVLTRVWQLGALPDPEPTPPEPPAPEPPEPAPPEPPSNVEPDIRKSEVQSASLLPVVLVAGVVGAALWAWKSSLKRRNL